MASTIILSDNGASSGSAGVKTTGGNDGTLTLQTTTSGGTATTAVYVDTSQNVGIGTSSPDAKLVISAYTGGGYNTAFNYGGQNNYIVQGTSGSTTFRKSDGTDVANIDSSANFKFNSGYGSVATAYGCRVWVYFTGAGTPAIVAGGNASSITDNGTGDYTVSFTTALSSSSYSAVFSASGTVGGSTNAIAAAVIVWSTGSVRLRTMMAGTFYDSDVCGAIFR